MSFGSKMDGSNVTQYDGISRPYSPTARNNFKDFYDNAWSVTNNIAVSGGNEKLLLESLNWMTSTDDGNSVSIPSKSLESTSLTVTDYDAAFWKICTIGLIPGVFLVAGFLIWLKRRKA